MRGTGSDNDNERVGDRNKTKLEKREDRERAQRRLKYQESREAAAAAEQQRGQTNKSQDSQGEMKIFCLALSPRKVTPKFWRWTED